MTLFLETIDLAATLSDSQTIQTAQALASWVRAKTGIERERHIGGQVETLSYLPL